jgi:tagatose-1,6-bisphosphate aldolase
MSVMTTAELRGYQQICGDNGAMMVIACDQRGGMRQLLADDPEAQAKIGNDVLGDTKADITRYLASEAGCVLVDPVCAVPHLVDNWVLPRTTALLIGLDASGWDVSPEGYRISKLCEGVNARKVRELGGTGGKIMVYLRSDKPEANTRNLEILKDCIDDFAREELFLVVEFLTYRLEDESKEAYEAIFSQLILDGCKLSLDLGAKVLKIPYPGSDEACAAVSKLCGDTPWAVLSAGVDHSTFLVQVESAMKHGASGVIAGRSLWKDCISLDRTVTKSRLQEIAVPRLREIQAIIDRYASVLRRQAA